MRWSRLLPLVLALPVAAACSSGSRAPAPSPSPTSPTPSPATSLATLAAKGADASYTASYKLAATDPKTKPTEVRIFRLPHMLRVDVVAGGVTASLIQNPKGTYSCRASGKDRTCFAVAGPGKPVPPLFDAGLQRVFSTYLVQLAAHAGGYDVSYAGTTPARNGVPEGTCFAVKATTSSPTPLVSDGTYCLADTGMLTELRYPSGTLTLVDLSGPPSSTAIRPYSSPTPIP